MWTGGGSGKKKKTKNKISQIEWTMDLGNMGSLLISWSCMEKICPRSYFWLREPLPQAGTDLDKLGLPGMHQEV